ncbi:MAG TPA: redoxin domain-containing protein [Clostridiales bacterium]|nr:redoxin domain-containing protein [Clostridiales bacterium]
MFNDIVNKENISFILVFFQGLISFFAPCVLPLIPVYMSYLAGSTNEVGEDGNVVYDRKVVFKHTIFFVIGISFAFFILGMTFSTIGKFFNTNKMLFTRIGGIIIIMLGLFQLGIFDLNFLQSEKKININFTDKKVNPIMALIMGFTFSFAWTPCVGPALTSVLILASGAKTAFIGNMLVLVYALGFVIPFLVLGLFTVQVLKFLKDKKNIVKYTIKLGGIILVIIGIMTFTGWMNGVSSYLNKLSFKNEKYDSQLNEDLDENIDENIDGDIDENIDEDTNSESKDNEASNTEDPQLMPAIDFTLMDQYGNEHKLSDYKGKVVFLNFWASWCPPCKKEMPHIEELYNEYNLNKDDVVILGVANPKSKEYPHNQDEKKEDIIKFLEDNNYTFPTVFDETGRVFSEYSISSFPTTFLIDMRGNVLGYVPGMLTKDMMISVINQTLDYTKE